MSGDTDVGLQADAAEAMGARLVRPIFAFPGGRRFQFLDPAGNEIACVKSEQR